MKKRFLLLKWETLKGGPSYPIPSPLTNPIIKYENLPMYQSDKNLQEDFKKKKQKKKKKLSNHETRNDMKMHNLTLMQSKTKNE